MKRSVRASWSSVGMTPLGITAVYFIFGLLWILFSDHILAWFIRDPTALTKGQTVKGLAYVAATGILLYLLIRRGMAAIQQQQQAAQASELRYYELFKHLPISLWLEDLSTVRQLLVRWQADGEIGLRVRLTPDSAELQQCVSEVQVVDVNRATLALYETVNKSALLGPLDLLWGYTTDENVPQESSQEARWHSLTVFAAELLALWEGRPVFGSRIQIKTMKGNLRYADLLASVVPGYEETWERVLVSLVDVSGQVAAEAVVSQMAQRQAILRELDQAILTLHSPRDIVETTLKYLLQVTAMEQAYVELFDVTGQEPDLVLTMRNTRLTLSPLDTVVAWYRDRGEDQPLPTAVSPQLIKDLVMTQPTCAGMIWLRQQGSRSAMSLPVVLQGTLMGLMNLGTRQPGLFSADDLAFAAEVSNSLAVAMAQIRLQEAKERKHRETELWAEITAVLLSTLEFNQVVELILDRLMQIIRFDRAAVFLQEGQYLYIVHSQGFSQPESLLSQPLTVDNPLFVHVKQTRQPLVLADAQSHPDFHGWYDTHHTGGWMGLPLFVQGTVMGFVTIDSLRSGAYTPEDARRIQPFINQAAQALHNATLYRRIQAQAQELEARVADRTAELRTQMYAVETLNQRTNRLVTDLQLVNGRLAHMAYQLKITNAELEAFAFSISHDLRAPLRSIEGFSQALLEEQYTRLDAQGQDYLQRVCLAAVHMSQLIDDLLRLSRIVQQDIHWEMVNLSRLALQILADLQERTPHRSVNLQVAPDVIAWGDLRLLRIALQNLLDNAWKFSRYAQLAMITFGLVTQGREVVYFVRDNGVGFDMTYVDDLFRPFRRLHHEADFPGTGIGLATAKRIIHRHNGRIWVESVPHQQTTFYFTLNPLEEIEDE